LQNFQDSGLRKLIYQVKQRLPVLFPFFYPIILSVPICGISEILKNILGFQSLINLLYIKEQLKINISAKNLLNHHIFMIFEKEKGIEEVDFRLDCIIKPFEKIM